MDFASLLKSQISASKSSSQSPATGPNQKKYLKRSELEAQREAAYLAEQEALAAARETKRVEKRKYEEDEAEKARMREEKRRRLAEESRVVREEEEREKERKRRRRLGLPEVVVEEKKEEGEKEGEMDEEELVKGLREMGEPVRLFGEGDRARRLRYKRLTGQKVVTVSTGPIPTTLKLVPEAEMKIGETMPTDHDGRQVVYSQLASYFTMVLSEWEAALGAREAEVQKSFQGKAAYSAMVRAREDMKPLFKRMEKKELDDGILEPIMEIVRYMQARRYVDANDAYLRLSIGKAAWPIGVTMVGIHERSAREKLHESDKTAHIMSDEITRKFLQSIKRCLTFAQTRWPPDDQLQLMG
ncbi:hypothetical protein P152DRAFT_461471 [Eremomyces bilateralis CBS 781.70]|uniref:Pre-mRNA-splicing factor 18 n=1 Tax=Eremomyces bilateralis CBS 781.70 TaxID=1392243 RepID=A0A6G1FV38_9PEZI|nr:uncharacterized protein P152DRAFT_461471 [Eremomyces bilateralis CBS 781.70]KAF1809521.1 hypothetical protein P152DRAFT_461471 [Eremomyces bilateralis CBS 781.70]